MVKKGANLHLPARPTLLKPQTTVHQSPSGTLVYTLNGVHAPDSHVVLLA